MRFLVWFLCAFQGHPPFLPLYRLHAYECECGDRQVTHRRLAAYGDREAVMA